ncbi:uncharacterized protein LOC111642708 [Centruroides sculpturatus]|uniref:uncharacterized protein LOC111642708 n=1 Tax=Centruroides sculpturatus TaxID=218467 RepID=UPI000C6CAD52|nr:uncharacterized protein LOC111642708 [Centruroides sculpturatus]
MSAIEALKDVNNKGKLVQDIWHLLRDATKENILYFCWVKAHVGHEGNETADRLAKEACKQDTNPTYSLTPLSSMKHQLKLHYRTRWQHLWSTSAKGRDLFAFPPDVNQRIQSKHIDIDHHTTAFLTNHGDFKGYLYRYGHAPSPLCVSCGVLEDPLHILFNCNCLEATRHELRLTSVSEGFKWPISPSSAVLNNNLYNIVLNIIRTNVKQKKNGIL